MIPYLLIIQLKTGLRGEVAGLTWDCVLWKTSEIKTYQRYDTVRKKWTPPRTTDLDSQWKNAIDEEAIKF